jgi:hypothetical protein
MESQAPRRGQGALCRSARRADESWTPRRRYGAAHHGAALRCRQLSARIISFFDPVTHLPRGVNREEKDVCEKSVDSLVAKQKPNAHRIAFGLSNSCGSPTNEPGITRSCVRTSPLGCAPRLDQKLPLPTSYWLSRPGVRIPAAF